MKTNPGNVSPRMKWMTPAISSMKKPNARASESTAAVDVASIRPAITVESTSAETPKLARPRATRPGAFHLDLLLPVR